jgi:hypothetical protein
MGNPYYWLKKRWYRRQVIRAIWFLRYTDRLVHSLGWNRPKVRQFWEDFAKHPEARRKALNEIAVINKIKIREQRRGRMERQLEIMMVSNQKLQLELNKASAMLAQVPKPEPMTAGGPAQEETHEVPSV